MYLYHDKYPKYYVAVDCIVFGYENSKLKLLLYKRHAEPSSGEWSLIGGWVKEEETVEQAADRVLHQITGLQDKQLELVGVFSKPDRDPGGRVISVVYSAMIRIDKHDRDLVEKHGAAWWAFDKRPELIFDHDSMVCKAHSLLMNKAEKELLGQKLLPSKFTIMHLRSLYEAILQRSLDPANFRKKVLSTEKIERLEDKNKSESKKGAFYYRFKKSQKEIVIPVPVDLPQPVPDHAY